jgi:4a-hydroxytetrahydrobiopterin dehydratase
MRPTYAVVMSDRPGREPLSPGALQAVIAALDGWRAEDAALVRTFRCADFRSAVAFIGRIADAAEAADHHPDLCLRRYRDLEVRLTTHDAGGVTAWDVELARVIDGLAHG